jgi:hypothetical protein
VALTASEVWRGGFVVDATTGATGGWVVTYSLIGAAYWGGFLRDADGRLVVVDG